jgi:MFS family permease
MASEQEFSSWVFSKQAFSQALFSTSLTGFRRPAAPRFSGVFMCASAFAGVIGGPMAGAILNHLSGVHRWAGWQWLFLIEGIPSVVAGVLTLFYLTDKPEKAGWLGTEEKQLLREDLQKDQLSLGPQEETVVALPP